MNTSNGISKPSEELVDSSTFLMVLLCMPFLFVMIYFLIVATFADDFSMWNTITCGTEMH